MASAIWILAATAASLGFVHTILGPDHYLPFIVLSKARKWSLFKTTWMTLLCGLGHVGSSIVIGAIGIALGLAVTRVEGVEASRGGIVAWLFIAFGLLYMVWGLHRAWKNKPHKHPHVHSDGSVHLHEHTHKGEHAHVHQEDSNKNLTPWILFIVFVLGPCEPLIPLLMYPASQHSMWGVAFVAFVFGAVTIATMLGMVLASYLSIDILSSKTSKLEKYTHAIAGATIFSSGMAIQFLGL